MSAHSASRRPHARRAMSAPCDSRGGLQRTCENTHACVSCPAGVHGARSAELSMNRRPRARLAASAARRRGRGHRWWLTAPVRRRATHHALASCFGCAASETAPPPCGAGPAPPAPRARARPPHGRALRVWGGCATHRQRTRAERSRPFAKSGGNVRNLRARSTARWRRRQRPRVTVGSEVLRRAPRWCAWWRNGRLPASCTLYRCPNKSASSQERTRGGARFEHRCACYTRRQAPRSRRRKEGGCW
jgi:hypothetical protein